MLSRHPSAPVCHAWSTPVTTTQSPGPSGCGPSSRTRLTFPDRTTLKSIVSVWCIGISRAGSNSTRFQRASPGTDGVGSRSWCPIGRAGGGDSFVSNMRFTPTPGMNVRKSANSRSSSTHDFPSSSIPVISPRTCISWHSPLAFGGRPRTERMCQAQNYGWPTRLRPPLIGMAACLSGPSGLKPGGIPNNGPEPAFVACSHGHTGTPWRTLMGTFRHADWRAVRASVGAEPGTR
jgi:hypothetical protein